MATGISLHIGLNAVNPAYYDGSWNGKLKNAVQDAKDMQAIATQQGFQATVLLDNAATREAVISSITQSSQRLHAGDMFFVSFAGHGGVLPDFSGDEADQRDETWCLYNGHLVDDELNALWNHFAIGVRILVITDSCHSGTVSRGRQRSRAMPLAVALATYRVRRDFYLRIMQHCKNQPAPVASVRLLSACSDQETTADGDKNGYFTSALKQVWADGTFVGDYNHFYEQIYAKLYPGQSPEHSIIGSWDETYNQQRPFML